MVIGDRLRHLQQEKKFSQGDIEKRTGLLRCYISRVENGHTVPAIETLEKIARALEVPMYRLFHEGELPSNLLGPVKKKSSDESGWGSSGGNASFMRKLTSCLSKATDSDRKLVLYLAQRTAAGHARRVSKAL